jgi:uncharacterized SAM-binding protein YcdF (DUF218 family)
VADLLPAVDPVALRAILKTLYLPPTGPLILAAAGLLLLGRRPRLGRRLAALGVALLFVLSVPAVAAWLGQAYAGDLSPITPERARTAQAIVIPGSGLRSDAPEYGGDTLGRFTLERVRYGARLARETGLPVLVSGGRLGTSVSEAALMRDSLEREFGVPVRYVEDRSRTTHENAQRSARILKADHIDRVVVVAQAVDMRRIRSESAAAGLAVVPAPIDLPGEPELSLRDLLPGIGGLAGSWRVIYEATGEAVRAAAAWLGGER